MDMHCDCGEPTAVGEPPQPSGKLNRTAFKLFKRRKSGGTMPSIFGVRGGKGKSGEGGGQAGMVRSKTHDGLAEAVLESGKKEEPGGGGGGDEQLGDGAKEPSPSSSAAAAVGKSHSFFALLRKNGGKSERPKGRGGLKGLFSSMRWPRRDSKPGGGGAKEDEVGESSESQPSPSLLMPGSLTASLECIKEEAPRLPVEAPPSSPGLASGDKRLSPQTPEAATTQEKEDVGAREPQAPLHSPQGEEPPRIQAKERHPQPPESDGQETKEDSAITGCGDIIADQEDDAGSGSGGGGSDKSVAGVSKPGASRKPPSVVAYQGGGEEMASPEQVGDTCAPEFWDMLSQTEDKSQETPGGTESLEASKDGRRVQDGSASEKHIGVNQIPVHHKDQKSREKEQQEAVPSGDEGYWDSTTPGPEEDNANSIQKEWSIVVHPPEHDKKTVLNQYSTILLCSLKHVTWSRKKREVGIAEVRNARKKGQAPCTYLLSPSL